MALRKLFSSKNLVSFVKNASVRPIATSAIRAAHVVETDVEFDQRYEKYFNNPNLDGWMLRKGINDLQGYDLVPEPKIISSVLHACRRVDDYALAVRFLEAVKDKCGPKVKTIWPYLLVEIRPTLDELGILTPEQMGYDKPELACKSVWDM